MYGTVTNSAPTVSICYTYAEHLLTNSSSIDTLESTMLELVSIS